MAREIKDQVLSFGELQQPHEVLTIAYAGVRMETNKLYKGEGTFPTDAMQQLIIYLQEQAENMEGDGVKNIDIKVVTCHDENGNEVVDYLATGTIFRLV
jgi:uncharacterized protein YbjQ (UPF0145 family)